MIDLITEQQQPAIIAHDYACHFSQTEDGDAQLLQGCYDYMDAFKRVIDSASKVQMDYICLQYPWYFRFAIWMGLYEGKDKDERYNALVGCMQEVGA